MSQDVPKALDYSLPAEIDMQVRENLSDLFSGTYKSVLYVGANHLRQHFLSEFVSGYDRVVVLEIFPRNVAHLKKNYTDKNTSIIHGDVRDAAGLTSGRFDVCFFWHGPEHLGRDEVGTVLRMLESITDSLVVLGMPYGNYPQGAEYGNKYETHLWDVYPADMERLGYLTHTIGDANDTLSNMMAWKRMDDGQ